MNYSFCQCGATCTSRAFDTTRYLKPLVKQDACDLMTPQLPAHRLPPWAGAVPDSRWSLRTNTRKEVGVMQGTVLFCSYSQEVLFLWFWNFSVSKFISFSSKPIFLTFLSLNFPKLLQLHLNFSLFFSFLLSINIQTNPSIL